MSRENLIVRYRAIERINHWIVAFCFVLLALSGLALFYPAFFWLTGVFGTPQLARIIHPFVGVVMFTGFSVMFLRYWKHNLVNREDIKWMMAVGTVLKGGEAIKVWEAEAQQGSGAPGSVLSADVRGVRVACGSGVLNMTLLQRAGGKRLAAGDFLRGFELPAGAQLGEGAGEV